jgi:hypothetical protein
VLGLSVEDRVRLGGRKAPIAARDLGLKLTKRPARVADEDPQTVHGLASAIAGLLFDDEAFSDEAADVLTMNKHLSHARMFCDSQ